MMIYTLTQPFKDNEPYIFDEGHYGGGDACVLVRVVAGISIAKS